MLTKTERDNYIHRIDALDKIGTLALLDKRQCATVVQVAAFYEAQEETIRKAITRHRAELDSDGISLCSYNNLLTDGFSLQKKRGGFDILDNTGTVIDSGSNKGILLIPKRGILRLGMLLRNNEIAIMVRNYLLDVECDTQEKAPEIIKNIVDENNIEMNLINKVALAYANGSQEELMIATKALSDYKLEIKNNRIIELEREKEVIFTHALTITDSKKNINAIMRAIAIEYFDRDFSGCWNELWRYFNYYYNINVRARRKRKESLITLLSLEELNLLEQMVRQWATDCGLNVEHILVIRLQQELE